jgi:hypothetical protein
MENTISQFGQLISNVVQREIVFHLSDPTSGIRAIKFVHLHARGTHFPLKFVGRKRGGMGVFKSPIKVLRCGRREMRWGGIKQGGQIVHCVQALLTGGGQLSDGCGK